MTPGAAPTLANINITALPARLTEPLRRDGLDPVLLDGSDRDCGDVLNIGRVLGFTVWLVTGLQLTRAVLNDSSYSTDIRSLMGGTRAASAIGGLGFTDPPDHTALRKILLPEFTARRLSSLRPTIERIVDAQLDAMELAGPVVDVVAQFAFPVPFQVISELLGLPADDQQRFQGLGHDRFDVTQGGVGIFDAISQSRTFIRDAVRRQREAPGSGLIAGMLRTHGDVDDEVIAGLADGVFTGGYETSASMLALGVLTLIRDPATFHRIQQEPSAIEGIVDELIRYLSVVQIAFPRFARKDLVLSGHRIREGDVVICSLSRANRDAAFGEAPDRFDPSRPPAPHVAFGHGFHRCIGAELARMQLQIAFRALAQRFPQMTLAAPAADLQFHDLSIVYGLKTLPVRLHGDADGGSTTMSTDQAAHR